MTDEMFRLRLAVRRLDRYIDTGGMGMMKDQVAGEWLRRADVLALLDELDVLRDGVGGSVDNP